MPLFQAGLSSYDATLFQRSSSSKHHCKRQTTKPNTARKKMWRKMAAKQEQPNLKMKLKLLV